jgi:hypothetical protein
MRRAELAGLRVADMDFDHVRMRRHGPPEPPCGPLRRSTCFQHSRGRHFTIDTVTPLRPNAFGHHAERHLSIGRLQGLLMRSAAGERTAVDNFDARGARTQLITRRLPLRAPRCRASDSADEHTADPKIARNEQVRGLSPRPGSQQCDQRRRNELRRGCPSRR